jgi:putative intracellular protease/amidase
MIRNEHIQSQSFLEHVYKRDWKQVKDFLMKRNEARGGVTGVVSRTVILMDATGSMSDVLDACKSTVRNMLNRAHDILKQHKVASSFEVQFVVYRNYSSRAEAILQYSGWESDPENIYLEIYETNSYKWRSR